MGMKSLRYVGNVAEILLDKGCANTSLQVSCAKTADNFLQKLWTNLTRNVKNSSDNCTRNLVV